ncbi:hypothetical protein BGZ83_010655, partial [Gryganskiella cystojenkinii]
MSATYINSTNPDPGVTYTTTTLAGAPEDIVVTDEQWEEGDPWSQSRIVNKITIGSPQDG